MVSLNMPLKICTGFITKGTDFFQWLLFMNSSYVMFQVSFMFSMKIAQFTVVLDICMHSPNMFSHFLMRTENLVTLIAFNLD